MSSFDSLTDVAIVGAGPYGLSLASHLTERGVDHRIFGAPMQAWREMLPGMFLKSPDFATTISTPRPGHGFLDFCPTVGRSSAEPCSIALFTEYGQWAQERLVPELEQCTVESIESRGCGFAVELDTGERLTARRVVVAIGLTDAWRLPAVFDGLPTELVTHTSHHRDIARFRGMDVTVIGAGQSALETAALLHENGASPRLVIRGGGAYFASPPVRTRTLRQRVVYPMSGLGPGRLNLFLHRVPQGVHLLMSDERRVRLTRRHLGPWGAWWLRERVEGRVPVHAGCTVVGAVPRGSGLDLRIGRRDGSEWEVHTDHVVCGTGYEVDLDRMRILDPSLRARIRRLERAPHLDRHFESSVVGLHFVGVASAFSFGPLFRFVAGAGYTASTLARRLAATAGASAVRHRPAAFAEG